MPSVGVAVTGKVVAVPDPAPVYWPNAPLGLIETFSGGPNDCLQVPATLFQTARTLFQVPDTFSQAAEACSQVPALFPQIGISRDLEPDISGHPSGWSRGRHGNVYDASCPTRASRSLGSVRSSRTLRTRWARGTRSTRHARGSGGSACARGTGRSRRTGWPCCSARAPSGAGRAG